MSNAPDERPASADSPEQKPPGLLFHLGLVARLRAYFFAGVLVTAPISITFYIAWLIIASIDSSVQTLLPAKYHPENFLPFSVPGIGLIAVLIGLTAIGALTAGLLGRILVRLSERIVLGMPVVRGIYGVVKQIVETVMARNASAFREVVLVQFPIEGSWTLGFVTGVSAAEFRRLVAQDLVNVFVPTTPNPTSGFLLYIPRAKVRPVSLSVEEAIKLVVSGGIIAPGDVKTEGARAIGTPPERAA